MRLLLDGCQGLLVCDLMFDTWVSASRTCTQEFSKAMCLLDTFLFCSDYLFKATGPVNKMHSNLLSRKQKKRNISSVYH